MIANCFYFTFYHVFTIGYDENKRKSKKFCPAKGVQATLSLRKMFEDVLTKNCKTFK